MNTTAPNSFFSRWIVMPIQLDYDGATIHYHHEGSGYGGYVEVWRQESNIVALQEYYRALQGAGDKSGLAVDDNLFECTRATMMYHEPAGSFEEIGRRIDEVIKVICGGQVENE